MYKYRDYLIDKKLHRTNPDFKNIGILGENQMDEIIPNLFLGNYKAAYNKKLLDKNKIHRVIRICDNIESPFTNIQYLIIPVKDRDINVDDLKKNKKFKNYMISSLIKSIFFINDSLMHNMPILVHCKKGASRSAYIIVLYLMIFYGLSKEDAIKYIREKRPIALRNYKNIEGWVDKIYNQKDNITHSKVFLDNDMTI
jgi:protein-tyrosine phosphatase